MKAKIIYLSTKNRSLEEQVVLLQSQSGATSDLTKGLSVLQSVISDGKPISTTSADEDKQLMLQAKKTLDYFLDSPDAPPILAHLVKQLQLPPASQNSGAEQESYPPTVVLLIVSLFALQKHSKLEQDLQQEKLLQQEVVDSLRKRLEVFEKQNNKLKDLNDGIQALYSIPQISKKFTSLSRTTSPPPVFVFVFVFVLIPHRHREDRAREEARRSHAAAR
jgi:predicted ribosome quality control (RQC) complex YloA/Tae2 family protein